MSALSRAIRFKAKRVDNGEWVEGDNISLGVFNGDRVAFLTPTGGAMIRNTNKIDNVPLGIYCGAYEVSIGTVCQYTGMNDCKGKKIFEGDLLSCDRSVYEVQWGKEYEWTTFYSGVGEISLNDLGLNFEVEVVGNVYDK